MRGRIVNIETATPEYKHRQDDIVSFMINAHGGSTEVARQLNILYKRSGIECRYSTLPDFNLRNQPLFFSGKEYPTLSRRIAHYKKEAVSLSAKVARKCMDGHCSPQDITHIITVSCTGLVTPGIEMELMKQLDLKSNTKRHPINFIGCYAAVPALNLANLLCAQDTKAKILVICTELCTLHFQNENTRDNYTANALFGDGAAACLVVGADSELKGILDIGAHYSEVHHEGEEDMAWTPSEKGFLMKLSSYVPQLIYKDIQAFTNLALQNAHVNQEEVQWAYHPGGIQILQKVADAMQLNKDDLIHSYNVLRDYGNMSSPTILFVIKDILDTGKSNKDIFCSAFGPGLTFESILLHHVS